MRESESIVSAAARRLGFIVPEDLIGQRLRGDVEVVTRYGDPGTEHMALHRGCGVYECTWREHLVLTGEDASRFLHGLVTCEVKGLRLGDSRYGYFTDIRGRVLSDVVIRRLQEGLWLEIPSEVRERIVTHLEQYRVADRVEIDFQSDFHYVSVVGPLAGRAGASVLAEEAPPAEVWQVREGHQRRTAVAFDGRWPTPACCVRAHSSCSADVVEGLLRQAGSQPVGFEAVEAFRIESAIPRFGCDFDSDNLPQEIGESGAVDFDKGCYLGQEVVARLHYRGQVARRLVAVRFEGACPPNGTELMLEGRSAGRITSATPPLRAGQGAGLALVARRAQVPGTRLETSAGGWVEVGEALGAAAVEK